MEFFHILSLLIVLSAGFAFINFRFIKLPTSIGLMLVSILFSLLILALGRFEPAFSRWVETTLQSIDFSDLLLEGMLSFMLFAGAIHVRYEDLKTERLSIVLFSTLSVLISTFVVGYITYLMLNYFGFEVKLIEALIFGSLISPTDPIAVLSILKKAGVTKSLETKIAGESLFNDGVAVVVFLTLYHLAGSDAEPNFSSIATLFLTEAGGGIILGLLFGYVSYKMIVAIDNYQVEVLISLATVMGGYTAAHYLHVSGPLAMVVAGLITGNSSKSHGMSDITAEYIDKFWELVDEILNAILFVLIGLELLIIDISQTLFLLSAALIFITLIVRYFSVWVPSLIIRMKEKMDSSTLIILTWGGLRGGISIALALSIQPTMHRNLWVTITYIIVCFSILVQGMTVGKLAKRQRLKTIS